MAYNALCFYLCRNGHWTYIQVDECSASDPYLCSVCGDHRFDEKRTYPQDSTDSDKVYILRLGVVSEQWLDSSIHRVADDDPWLNGGIPRGRP